MGRQIALSFAAEGAKVVVGDIQEELGAETIALITAAGGQAIFHKTDVSQTADVDALIALAVSHFGGLNHAVNAAAKNMQSDAPACNTCGHITIRSGTCYKCLNCGNSMGCS